MDLKHWTSRNGVWVETDQGVGIRVLERVLVKQDGSRQLVQSYVQPGDGETVAKEPWVHLVNADGTTLAQLPEGVCGNVRQARYKSIPESRRAGMTKEQFEAMGYA